MIHPSILIVGGTGQLGTRLVRRLVGTGVRPRVLVRSPPKTEAIAAFATPVRGDLRDPESLGDAFRGVERVFVVAPPVPEMAAIERNAIEAAVSAGARRIVYLSNFTAKEGSDLPPNHVHGLHEKLIASLDIEWTVLGPTRYMASMPFNWPSVLNDGVLLEAGGSGIMTCVDPDEVAEVAAKMLTEDGHSGQTYRLTSEDEFTAASLAELLTAIVGRPIRVFDGDPADAPMGKYFAMVAAGLYRTTDTLRELLGRQPRGYADWLQDNLPAGLGRSVD